MDFRQPRLDPVHPQHLLPLQRLGQQLDVQRRQRLARHGREAQVPWFRPHPALAARVRPEEAEAAHVLVQPVIQPAEHAAQGVFVAGQLDLVTGRHRCPVDDVHVGTPVVSARARQRGPQQDGLDSLRLVQAHRIQWPAGRIEQRPVAAELGIPQLPLALEVAKGGDGFEIDPDLRCRMPHRHERIRRIAVHEAMRAGRLRQVCSRPSSDLQRVHSLSSKAEPGSPQARPEAGDSSPRPPQQRLRRLLSVIVSMYILQMLHLRARAQKNCGHPHRKPLAGRLAAANPA